MPPDGGFGRIANEGRITSGLLRPGTVEKLINDTVERQVTQERVTSSCPDILVAKVGQKFECRAAGGDESATVVVTQTSAGGAFSYRVKG